jgi:hypothetical protein
MLRRTQFVPGTAGLTFEKVAVADARVTVRFAHNVGYFDMFPLAASATGGDKKPRLDMSL